MKTAFVDTLYWVALVLPKDQWKEAAVRARRDLGQCLLITTDEVFTEFLNALSAFSPLIRQKAVQTVRQMMRNPNLRVLPQTRDAFLRALDRYEQRPDKEYSLVDCASMNAMDAEGIREILTNDHHFEQEGYTILIKKQAPA